MTIYESPYEAESGLDEPPSPQHIKKLHIKTYGCQMNVYDSERMVALLKPHGYSLTEVMEDADICILNTCHIREKATEKVYSDIGRIKKTFNKHGKAQPILAVAGCTAQAEGEEIMKRAPDVNVVIGPQNYHRLPEILVKYERELAAKQATDTVGKKTHIIDTDFVEESKFDHLLIPDISPISAFVSIQEGCDKFCTFCVVPYTRGAEYSRPPEDVIHEVKQVCARGAKEITLLGQNVNAYHGDDAHGTTWNLARLCYALADIEGLERLRYTTSHPLEMDDALIQAHGDNNKLMPFLHLPIQSGSNAILKAMNRKHTRDDYTRIIDKLRHARPDIALSSDFIVGFPGESDKDFADTIALVNEVTFASSFSFKYSPRPGTPASLMPPVDAAIQQERLSMLQQLLTEQQHQFNHHMIDTTCQILIEKTGRYDGQLVGRSPWLQPVHVMMDGDLEHHYGRIYNCHITAMDGFSLFGTICQ